MKMNRNSFIGTVADGFAESTRNINAINKEHMAVVTADSKAVWDAAKAPDPGVARVKEAKGLGNKVKAVGQNIKDGCTEASANEKAFRAEVQSGEQYRAVLESSRDLQKTMVGPAAIFNPYFQR